MATLAGTNCGAVQRSQKLKKLARAGGITRSRAAGSIRLAA